MIKTELCQRPEFSFLLGGEISEGGRAVWMQTESFSLGLVCISLLVDWGPGHPGGQSWNATDSTYSQGEAGHEEMAWAPRGLQSPL